MRIRIDAAPNLSGQDLDAVRLIGRTPIGQLVVQRRLLIRALIRRGFTRDDVRKFLRLTHAQVVAEESA